MAYQLSIGKQEKAASEQTLQRRRVLSFAELPLRVGGPDCDVELAGESGELFRIELADDGQARLCSDRCAVMRISQAERPLPTLLTSGDEIETDAWNLRFYVDKPRPRPSWQGSALARLSFLTVTLVLMAQLFTVALLPALLHRADPSSSAVLRQRLTEMLDTLRRRSSSLASEDPLQQCLALAISEELTARARHIRQYDDDMSRSQRREMLTDLQVLSYLLDRMEAGELFQPLPTPAVNAGVEYLLRQ